MHITDYPRIALPLDLGSTARWYDFYIGRLFPDFKRILLLTARLSYLIFLSGFVTDVKLD